MWSSIIRRRSICYRTCWLCFTNIRSAERWSSSGMWKVSAHRASISVHIGSGWDSDVCLLLRVCNILQFLISNSALRLYTMTPSFGPQHAYFRLTLSSASHYSWQWFQAIVWELWKWRFQSTCRSPERHHFSPLLPSWCTPTAHHPTARQA